VLDRDLFARLLEPGERSALFISPSKIQKRYGKHMVYFFYLRLNGEIARVEVPRWVAEDRIKLDLVHTLVVDQCRRGQGYPVALSEAHEKAVVTGADRDNFWRMVDESLVEEHLPVTESEKSRSKRTRWI
jgi:NurA-like 5'-3' nuclease